MDARRSIAIDGGCVWDWWEGVQEEMEKWDSPEEDEVAIAHLDTLIERAEGSGIQAGNLTAPEGLMLGRQRLPWIGALKSMGIRQRPKEGARNYRLYFSEVPVGKRALLASRLSWKGVAWDDEFTRRHQTKQIRDAVGIVEKYCRESACECRVIDTSA